MKTYRIDIDDRHYLFETFSMGDAVKEFISCGEIYNPLTVKIKELPSGEEIVNYFRALCELQNEPPIKEYYLEEISKLCMPCEQMGEGLASLWELYSM